mmetsp:Transcript_93820/g.247777  ORF Transcript_93820/g.247777 Transcript_93820/m.247777 type:complete len:98 (+) Transcript_93820:2-295(+)
MPSGSQVPEEYSETKSAEIRRFKEQAWMDEAVASATKLGLGALSTVFSVQEELEMVTDESGKNTVLRRLVRDLHPDQNPGRETEVIPAFQLVQKLRK